jgi:pimeloyl-ACP methyl ester carboxylesterase
MSGSRNDSIFTVVSRPGPVERRILDGLGPTIASHRRVGAGVSLRTLEGGEGPTVVFLHGRGHAASIWAPLLARFAARHRVVAVDLPGFGHSGAPPFDASTPSDGLRFFVEPIEDLLVATCPAPVTLVGHSLGGFVALALALGGRVSVRALALVDAMGLGPELPTKSRLYLRSGPERIARLRSMLAVGAAAGSDLEALRTELLTVRGGRPRASRAFDAMVPLSGAVHHVGPRLGEVRAPTLLLWGARDEAFPLRVAEEAARTLPRAELVTVDAAHSPHVESPGRTGDELERFLRAVEG